MHLAHRAFQAEGQLAVQVAKARVLLGRPVGRLHVIFPQQRKRDVRLLEALMHRAA